jgi:hypothetical protein
MTRQVKLKGTQCGSPRFPRESSGSRFPSVPRGVWGRVQGYDFIRRRWMRQEWGHDRTIPRERRSTAPSSVVRWAERVCRNGKGQERRRVKRDRGGRSGLPGQNNNGPIRELDCSLLSPLLAHVALHRLHFRASIVFVSVTLQTPSVSPLHLFFLWVKLTKC